MGKISKRKQAARQAFEGKADLFAEMRALTR